MTATAPIPATMTTATSAIGVITTGFATMPIPVVRAMIAIEITGMIAGMAPIPATMATTTNAIGIAGSGERRE